MKPLRMVKALGIIVTMSSAEMKTSRNPDGEYIPIEEAMKQWEEYFEALDSVGMTVYGFDPGFSVQMGPACAASIPVSVAKKIKALYDRVKELENEQAR